MLEILIEKKMLFPLILFVAVYAAIEISFYRGHAAGTAEEKQKTEKLLQEKEKQFLSKYFELERSQDEIIRKYQEQITAIEAEQIKVREDIENENLKIKDSLNITSSELSECLQRSKAAASGLPKTADKSGIVCFSKSDIQRRIEKSVAVGSRCDKLAHQYNALLEVCTKY